MNCRHLAACAAVGTMLLAGCGRDAPEAAADADDAPVTVESLTENSDRYEGLFTLFVDRDDGTVRMLIPANRFGAEHIYYATVEDGPSASGLFRGRTGVAAKNGIVRVERHFDRVHFIEENSRYHFDPDSALSRAADANISPAVLAVAGIEAEDDSGAVLIDAAPLFLGDAFMQLKPSPTPDGEPPAFDMGALSEEKSRFTGWRAYPENLDVSVEYVFENPAPKPYEAEDLTDPRYASVFVQHSFVTAPDNGYQPRSYDPRIGFFVSRRTDLTSPAAAPWRDYINRWHLKKRDPAADLSEPVEPIVFWVENTTPVEFRDVIVEAGLSWNRAFEQAGFRNAIDIRIQPDDADWDAGDIRYNVIRWTSSPSPRFGGYGPRIVDPRTGQIIGTDIMLEMVFMTNRVRYDMVFGGAPQPSAMDSPELCHAAELMQAGTGFARAVLQTKGLAKVEESELLEQALRMLVVHEMGHTLGLNHNFIASQMLAVDDHYSREITETKGLSGSIMDYWPPNIAPEGREQGLYYEREPGPYDRWAIEYGYSEALEDPAAEAARLEAILSRSTERELWFANDADDMRAPGAGIDPRIMIFDRSSDGIGYATNTFALTRQVMSELPESYAEDGATWQEMVTAYGMLTGIYGSQAVVVSRYVGGVYVDRAVQGQPGATEPYRPVPLAQQRRAMATLERYVFAAEAFRAPEELYRRLQTQRRDFDFYGKTEDPKIHQQALAVQKSVLDHLLHPVVLMRLTDTTLYGNEYRVADMMADLTAAVFDADMDGEVNAFRQNLQSEYVGRLVAMIAPDNAGGYDQPSRAMALYTLEDLRRRLGAKRVGDVATRAHTAALLHSIDKALDKS